MKTIHFRGPRRSILKMAKLIEQTLWHLDFLRSNCELPVAHNSQKNRKTFDGIHEPKK